MNERIEDLESALGLLAGSPSAGVARFAKESLSALGEIRTRARDGAIDRFDALRLDAIEEAVGLWDRQVTG